MRRVVGIDFDGTLAEYTSWEGAHVVGKPFYGALEFVHALHEYYDIWIFSARASEVAGKKAIEQWVTVNGLDDLIEGVTHEKLYDFHAFVDDRAYRAVPTKALSVEVGYSVVSRNYSELLTLLIADFH